MRVIVILNVNSISKNFTDLMGSIAEELSTIGTSLAFWVIISAVVLFSIYSYSEKKYASLFEGISQTINEVVKLFTTFIIDILKAIGILFNFVKLLKELFFGSLNARVVRKLSTYGIIFLSIVSFITTFTGMNELFPIYNAALIAFGIQALILVLASQIVILVYSENGTTKYHSNRVMISFLLFCIGMPLVVIGGIYIYQKYLSDIVSKQHPVIILIIVVLVALIATLIISALFAKRQDDHKSGKYFQLDAHKNKSINRLVCVLILAISVSAMFSYVYIYEHLFKNIEETDNAFIAVKETGTYLNNVGDVVELSEKEIYKELDRVVVEGIYRASGIEDNIQSFRAAVDKNELNRMDFAIRVKHFKDITSEVISGREYVDTENDLVLELRGKQGWNEAELELLKGADLISQNDQVILEAVLNGNNQGINNQILATVVEKYLNNFPSDETQIEEWISEVYNKTPSYELFDNNNEASKVFLSEVFHVNKGLSEKEFIDKVELIQGQIDEVNVLVENRFLFTIEDAENLTFYELHEEYIERFKLYMSTINSLYSKRAGWDSDEIEFVYKADIANELLLYAYEVRRFYDKHESGFSSTEIDGKLKQKMEKDSEVDALAIVGEGINLILDYPDAGSLTNFAEEPIIANSSQLVEYKNHLLDLYRSISEDIHPVEKAFRKIFNINAYPLMAIWGLFIALLLDATIVILYLLRGRKGFRGNSMTCIRIIHSYAKNRTITRSRQEDIANVQRVNIIGVVLTLIISVSPVMFIENLNPLYVVVIFFGITVILNAVRTIFFNRKLTVDQKVRLHTKYNSIENDNYDKFYDDEFFRDMDLDKYMHGRLGLNPPENYGVMFLVNFEEMRQQFCDSFVFLLMNIQPINKISEKMLKGEENNKMSNKDEVDKVARDKKEKLSVTSSKFFSSDLMDIFDLDVSDLKRFQLRYDRQLKEIGERIKSIKSDVNQYTKKPVKFGGLLSFFGTKQKLSNIGVNPEEWIIQKQVFKAEVRDTIMEYRLEDIFSNINDINTSIDKADEEALFNVKIFFYTQVKGILEQRHQRFVNAISVHDELYSYQNTPGAIEKTVSEGRADNYEIVGYIDEELIEKTGYTSMMLTLQHYKVVTFCGDEEELEKVQDVKIADIDSNKGNSKSKCGSGRYYVKNEFVRLVNEILITTDIDSYEDEFEEFEDEIY